MITKVFQKKLSFPQIMLWTTWLQFWLPHCKHLPRSENVLINQLQKIWQFSTFFLLQKILWTRRIQFCQAQRKFFVKSRFFSFEVPKLISKRGFFWNFCLKKSYGYVAESAVLTTMRNVARQNSGNFLIEVGKQL